MHRLAARGMFELQHEGVKRLSREAIDHAFRRLGQRVGLRPEGGAVIGIADQRMPDMGHVNPYLMGSSRFQPAGHKGKIFELFDDFD